MSYFKRARNFKKGSSKILDEKIAKANQEFKKTGVLEYELYEDDLHEKMSTSGMYYADKEIPAIPAEYTPVPDPNGVTQPGFTPPTGGHDPNDPSTWDNSFTDTDWLRNPNEVGGETNRQAVLGLPDSMRTAAQNSRGGAEQSVRYPDAAGEGGGFVIAGPYWGTALGYLGKGGEWRQVCSGGLTGGTNVPHEGSRGYGGYYNGLTDEEFNNAVWFWEKYSELITKYGWNNIPTVATSMWIPWSYFWHGSAGATYEEYPYTKRDGMVLTGASVVTDQNQYESSPYVPAWNQVIFQDDLGNPSNLPIKPLDEILGDLYEIGQNAVEGLQDLVGDIADAFNDRPTSDTLGDMWNDLTDHWNDVKDDLTNHDDVVQFGEDLMDLFDDIKEQLPAIDYSVDIASSVLQNKPIDNSDSISESDIDNLIDNINYDNIDFNDNKVPYADDNIITDDDGNVRPRNPWPTDENGEELSTHLVLSGDLTDEQQEQVNAWRDDQENHPNNTGPTHSSESASEMHATAGQSNPLAAQGQAQTQIYTNENGELIFSFTDHAYHNLNSGDPGEVPDPIKDGISSMVHAVSDLLHDRGEEQTPNTIGVLTPGGISSGPSTAPNTGGMAGYPSDIRGDSIYQVERPVSELSQEFQDWVYSQKSTKTEEFLEGTGQLLIEKNYLRDRREARRSKQSKKRKSGDKVSSLRIDGPKDHLTVKAVDMLRNHYLTESEKKEYARKVGRINQWIRDNPKEYEIWKVRYPKKDPRLATLNWELDQRLKSSEEYLETRFPENQKLYAKLKKKIKVNIDATDPKRFKKEKAEIVYTKLLKVSKAIKLDTIAPL